MVLKIKMEANSEEIPDRNYIELLASLREACRLVNGKDTTLKLYKYVWEANVCKRFGSAIEDKLLESSSKEFDELNDKAIKMGHVHSSRKFFNKTERFSFTDVGEEYLKRYVKN